MTSVKVKFCLSSDPELPGKVVYKIIHNKKAGHIDAGFRLFPYEWDNDSSKPFLSYNMGRIDFLYNVANRIDSDIDTLRKIIRQIKEEKQDYTPEDIIREFYRLRCGVSLFNYIEELTCKLRNLNQTATANNYLSALHSFRRFREDRDISLATIDSIVMEDYQNYMKAIGLRRNSISFYMRILRAVYNRAVQQGLTPDHHPFRKVFTGMEKTRKRAISAAEIKRIRSLDLSRHPALDFARDLFIFLFFCRGMSFIDAAFLKKSDLVNGIIIYRRHKTGKRLQIKSVQQINALLEKHSIPGSPFLLPIISEPGHDERRQYESALRTVNRSLKKIGKIAGLPVTLTTYVSRHSWATIAKSKNIPITVISEALGHESLATTQIYLDSIGYSVIDRANDIVIKGL